MLIRIGMLINKNTFKGGLIQKRVLSVYKKPGKIYYSTFQGHHDSIIKRLNKKHARKERYKKSINYNKRPKQTPLHGWNPFARSMLVYACEYIAFLLQGNQVCCYIS